MKGKSNTTSNIGIRDRQTNVIAETRGIHYDQPAKFPSLPLKSVEILPCFCRFFDGYLSFKKGMTKGCFYRFVFGWYRRYPRNCESGRRNGRREKDLTMYSMETPSPIISVFSFEIFNVNRWIAWKNTENLKENI